MEKRIRKPVGFYRENENDIEVYVTPIQYISKLIHCVHNKDNLNDIFYLHKVLRCYTKCDIKDYINNVTIKKLNTIARSRDGNKAKLLKRLVFDRNLKRNICLKKFAYKAQNTLNVFISTFLLLKNNLKRFFIEPFIMLLEKGSFALTNRYDNEYRRMCTGKMCGCTIIDCVRVLYKNRLRQFVEYTTGRILRATRYRRFYADTLLKLNSTVYAIAESNNDYIIMYNYVKTLLRYCNTRTIYGSVCSYAVLNILHNYGTNLHRQLEGFILYVSLYDEKFKKCITNFIYPLIEIRQSSMTLKNETLYYLKSRGGVDNYKILESVSWMHQDI